MRYAMWTAISHGHIKEQITFVGSHGHIIKGPHDVVTPKCEVSDLGQSCYMKSEVMAAQKTKFRSSGYCIRVDKNRSGDITVGYNDNLESEVSDSSPGCQSAYIIGILRHPSWEMKKYRYA